MERFKQKLLQAGIPFRENELLAAHCTFKIGRASCRERV